MRGLLIKDMKLMLRQKRSLLVVAGMGVMLMFTNGQPSSAIAYIVMLLTIFTISTISYDEYENGMNFLLTLPINRKTYVQEKFLFAGILALGSCVFAVAMAYMISMAKSIETSIQELFIVGGSVTAVALVIFAIILPLQIKFGAEKGRIAMFAVFAAVGVSSALAVKVMEMIDGKQSDKLRLFSELTPGFIVILALFALILVLLASYVISVKIISKKEY